MQALILSLTFCLIYYYGIRNPRPHFAIALSILMKPASEIGFMPNNPRENGTIVVLLLPGWPLHFWYLPLLLK
jgi:hypothetical protein